MKSKRESRILALCFALSLVFLALSLFCGARITARNDEAAALKLACESLRRENRRLEVSVACSENLSRIEGFAGEQLDMELLCAEQIIHIAG